MPCYTNRIPHESLDIEELNNLAKSQNFCSYYHNRYNQDEADIILLPYNYLLSQSIRESTNINLSNCIIIIDEAHNISEAAEDAFSFEINTKLLGEVIKEVEYLQKKYHENSEFLKNDQPHKLKRI